VWQVANRAEVAGVRGLVDLDVGRWPIGALQRSQRADTPLRWSG